MKLCIDPGHGGIDSGAVGFGSEEDALALAVALKLRAAAVRQGWAVKMTREADVYPSLATRCAIANDWDADLFVSVHFDAGPSTARGNSVLYYPSAASARLATCVNRHVETLTPWPDRGTIQRPGLAVLNGTHMPACLVEGAYITNSEEHALIVNPAWQTLEAEAITRGLCDYLGVAYKAPGAPAPAPAAQPFYLFSTHTDYAGAKAHQELADKMKDVWAVNGVPQKSWHRIKEAGTAGAVVLAQYPEG